MVKSIFMNAPIQLCDMVDQEIVIQSVLFDQTQSEVLAGRAYLINWSIDVYANPSNKLFIAKIKRVLAEVAEESAILLDKSFLFYPNDEGGRFTILAKDGRTLYNIAAQIVAGIDALYTKDRFSDGEVAPFYLSDFKLQIKKKVIWE